MNFLSVNLRGVRDPRKAEWIRGLKTSHGAHFLAIQESKIGDNDFFSYKKLWGKSSFELESVPAEGRAGGLLPYWDPTIFSKVSVLKKMTGELLNIVNVYAQNNPVARRSLWSMLVNVKNSRPGLWIFIGDFNDVRSPEERVNSDFIAANTNHFNEYNSSAELLEYNMGGRKFTYHSDNDLKRSKLDRVLVCHEFMNAWPTASLIAFSNVASDHCPISLSTIPTDFGPTPFRVYNSWLELPGLLDYIEESSKSFSFTGRADLGLVTKLKWLKLRIKDWVHKYKADKNRLYAENMEKLEALELAAESRSLSDQEFETRNECKKYIMGSDRLKSTDLRQKSRVRWAIDGDENSSYFHSIVNANIGNNRINGLMIDGAWISSPHLIKEEIFNFSPQNFKNPYK